MNKLKIKLVSGYNIELKKRSGKEIYEIGENTNRSRSGRDALKNFYKEVLSGYGTVSDYDILEFIKKLQEMETGIIEMKIKDIEKLFK